MDKRRQVTTEPTYEGHPILTNPKKNQGCDKGILKAIKRIADHALSERSRVMMMRYDVRIPHACKEQANNIFSTAQADFVKHLSRHGLSPHYVAVREESSNSPHYHVASFLDHSKTKSAFHHLRKMDEIVSRKVDKLTGKRHQGLVHFCDQDRLGEPQPNTHVISRNNQASYDAAFLRASYLAKVNTKPAKKIREVFVSKVKKKENNA